MGVQMCSRLVPCRKLRLPLGGIPRDARARSEAGGRSVGQTAWRLGVSIPTYREIEAAARAPNFETWDRICETFGWGQTFVGGS